MKKLILSVLLALICLCSYSQSKNQIPLFPMKDGTIFFEGIVQVDSTIKKEILYTRAREWFANYYNKANQVLQMDDKESGKLIGKGIFEYSFIYSLLSHKEDLKYTVNITLKDGKFRYQVYDLYSTDTFESIFSTRYDKPGIGEFDMSKVYLNNGKHKESEKYLSKLFTPIYNELENTIQSLTQAIQSKKVDNSF